jgi:hypothetical protein
MARITAISQKKFTISLKLLASNLKKEEGGMKKGL